MKIITVLDIDPEDLAPTVFQAGHYLGRVIELAAEEDRSGAPTLTFSVLIDLPGGHRRFDERIHLRSSRFFLAKRILAGLGATERAQLPEYFGARVRLTFEEPSTSRSGRRVNRLRRVELIEQGAGHDTAS